MSIQEQPEQETVIETIPDRITEHRLAVEGVDAAEQRLSTAITELCAAFDTLERSGGFIGVRFNHFVPLLKQEAEGALYSDAHSSVDFFDANSVHALDHAIRFINKDQRLAVDIDLKDYRNLVASYGLINTSLEPS